MGLINDIQAARRSRRQANRQERAEKVAQEIRQGFFLSPICSDYENLFAQVRPLINEMKIVRPFAVNDRGERIKNPNQTPELTILDYPNAEMGWAEFADLMFATWLTKDQLFIHVHFDEKRRNIIGYSIIPSSAYTWNGSEFVWDILNADGTHNIIRRDEVMTLRFSRSPDDPFKGVSPATAARVWAQTDDIVAQYQRAYFENGAIPATITFITASTREGYEQTRYELESKLKGAKNHNKTVYAWRQMLPGTGETKDQVEVKTIQAPNNTMAIDQIVQIINDRLNKAVGVSNFILGDDSSAKYSNAELSQQQFIRNRVYPALITFWSQFQFELDRITGGLGYAIQFELEIPELTERAQVRAETNKVNADTLIELIANGSDPTSAVQALELPEAWNKVAAGLYISALAGNNTKTEATLAGINNFTRRSDTLQANAPSCKCTHDAIELEGDEKKIYDLLMDLAQAIIDENPNASPEQVIEQMTELLEREAQKGGNKAYSRILDVIDDAEVKKAIQEAAAQGYQLSEAIQDRIKLRTSEIVHNYDAEVRDQMRSVLNNTRGLTAAEIKERLQQIIPEYRARMIARTETVYAFKSADLDNTEKISRQYDLDLWIAWNCVGDSRTCDVCAAMDGQSIPVGQAFTNYVNIPAGQILSNGHEFENDTAIYFDHSQWNDQGKIPAAHPNCRCDFLIYRKGGPDDPDA